MNFIHLIIYQDDSSIDFSVAGFEEPPTFFQTNRDRSPNTSPTNSSFTSSSPDIKSPSTTPLSPKKDDDCVQKKDQPKVEEQNPRESSPIIQEKFPSPKSPQKTPTNRPLFTSRFTVFKLQPRTQFRVMSQKNRDMNKPKLVKKNSPELAINSKVEKKEEEKIEEKVLKSFKNQPHNEV